MSTLLMAKWTTPCAANSCASEFVASVEQRLVSLKLGQSVSPLVDFLREFGEDAYRELVQYRLKSFSTRQLQDAALDDWAVAADALGLPAELEGFARVGATLKARYLVDQGYWIGPSARSCAEAFADIVSAVGDEVNLEPIRDRKVEALREHHQRVLLGLRMFATNRFAGLASESKSIRKHLGMRKGLFG
jgi:hypothetical protein